MCVCVLVFSETAGVCVHILRLEAQTMKVYGLCLGKGIWARVNGWDEFVKTEFCLSGALRFGVEGSGSCQYHFMPCLAVCHAMLWMPCHACAPCCGCHAMCHAVPYFPAMPHWPCHTMPCHAMPCHAMPCHTNPCHATPIHAMSHQSMPCHTNPCHATPIQAKSSHAKPATRMAAVYHHFKTYMHLGYEP
mgnify:CR=1 FL=1